MDTTLLTIQEFAKLCRSTPRTLRLYEQMDLLKPVDRGKWNNYRLYDPNQGRLFFRIKLLQNFHVSLEEISKVLKTEATQDFLTDKVATLYKEIEEKQKEYRFLRKFKKFFFEESLSQLVKVETLGPYFLFGKVVAEEHYHLLTSDFEALSELADALHLGRTKLSITLYLEPEKYKPLSTQIEISVVVKKGKIPSGEHLPEGYFLKEMPKTKVYSYKYKGPYEFITLIYERLHELEITKNLPVDFQPFDITFDDFRNKKRSIYDLTTRICFPLRQAQGRPLK
ncbi:MAG: MerR family transcriptional regulator [Candidatus Levyibacteriota bacterium]